MAVITLVLFSFVLTFLELSVMPFFKVFEATPFLVVPFLVILSVKYKGLFQLFLAFVIGAVFDFAAVGTFGRYTLIFLITVLAGRILFFRESNYNSGQAFLTLTILTTLSIYGSQLYVLYRQNFAGWQNFLVIIVSGLVLTLIFAALVYRFSEGYIEWLNKKHSESYKG
jgi:rod shape-determining protein MreD